MFSVKEMRQVLLTAPFQDGGYTTAITGRMLLLCAMIVSSLVYIVFLGHTVYVYILEVNHLCYNRTQIEE